MVMMMRAIHLAWLGLAWRGVAWGFDDLLNVGNLDLDPGSRGRVIVVIEVEGRKVEG